jgi:serine/threonine-protein kinase
MAVWGKGLRPSGLVLVLTLAAALVVAGDLFVLAIAGPSDGEVVAVGAPAGPAGEPPDDAPAQPGCASDSTCEPTSTLGPAGDVPAAGLPPTLRPRVRPAPRPSVAVPTSLLVPTTTRPGTVPVGAWRYTVLAGNGNGGFSGDGGPATEAALGIPGGAVQGSDGAVYFADRFNNRIRKVDRNGTISTIAGTGAGLPGSHGYDDTGGFSGDGGPAATAQLNEPLGVTIDRGGGLLIADYLNGRIRRIGPEGVITTVAGNGSKASTGDGGPATEAGVFEPRGVAAGPDGNIYIAEAGGNRVRKVSPAGVISTLAGTGGKGGFAGDGGPATAAQLRFPDQVAVGPDGSVYVADVLNNRIRRISNAGIITTFAGSGPVDDGQGNHGGGFGGDGGPAALARLAEPGGVTVSTDGDVYVADTKNGRIRRVDAAGIITTVAGAPGGSRDDGTPAAHASLPNPESIAFDPQRRLLIGDPSANRVIRLG